MKFNKRQQEIIRLWANLKLSPIDLGSEFVLIRKFPATKTVEFNPKYAEIAKRKLINDEPVLPDQKD